MTKFRVIETKQKEKIEEIANPLGKVWGGIKVLGNIAGAFGVNMQFFNTIGNLITQSKEIIKNAKNRKWSENEKKVIEVLSQDTGLIDTFLQTTDITKTPPVYDPTKIPSDFSDATGINVEKVAKIIVGLEGYFVNDWEDVIPNVYNLKASGFDRYKKNFIQYLTNYQRVMGSNDGQKIRAILAPFKGAGKTWSDIHHAGKLQDLAKYMGNVYNGGVPYNISDLSFRAAVDFLLK